MFGFFNRKKKAPLTSNQYTDLIAKIDTVLNTGNTGTLSWNDMFGNFHPNQLRGDKGQLGLSAVYCACSLYSGAITSLPRLTQRINPDNGLPIRYVSTTDHPAARIWSHYVNDEMDSDEFMKWLIYDVLFFDGNFYSIKEYDQKDRVLRSHYVSPTRIPRGNIRRASGGERLTNGRTAVQGEICYLINAGDSTQDLNDLGRHILVPKKDMVHIKGLIPDPGYFRSQGILENNARSAGLYDASEKMSSYFYSRGYTNQMFLSTEQSLSGPLQKEMETLFNGSREGLALEDIFKTRILQKGLKPIHAGLPPQAMQFIETRAFSVEDVSRWWNIPPGLLHSIMGTGTTPVDYDQQMMMWIQNGLGHAMTNIEKQFKNNYLSRASQPLYSFSFDRLHLFKTVINEFSQALRNLFEIGVINRVVVANLIGTHVDAADPANTQRYVPANILTTQHSKSVEKKAAKGLLVMDEQIAKMIQDREHSDEAFKTTQEQLKNPQPGLPPGTTPPGQPGPDPPSKKSGTGAPPVSKDDPKGDNATSGSPPKDTGPKPPKVSNEEPTPPTSTLSTSTPTTTSTSTSTPTPKSSAHLDFDKVLRQSLLNTLNGLHEYELRVIKQKIKSRPKDFLPAMNEWYPKFQKKLEDTLKPWEGVLEYLLSGAENNSLYTLPEGDLPYTSNLVNAWIQGSTSSIEKADSPSHVTNSFNSLTNLLMEKPKCQV